MSYDEYFQTMIYLLRIIPLLQLFHKCWILLVSMVILGAEPRGWYKLNRPTEIRWNSSSNFQNGVSSEQGLSIVTSDVRDRAIPSLPRLVLRHKPWQIDPRKGPFRMIIYEGQRRPLIRSSSWLSIQSSQCSNVKSSRLILINNRMPSYILTVIGRQYHIFAARHYFSYTPLPC